MLTQLTINSTILGYYHQDSNYSEITWNNLE